MSKVSVRVKWADKSGKTTTTQTTSDRLSGMTQSIKSKGGTIVSVRGLTASGGSGRTYYERKRAVPSTPAQHKIEERKEKFKQIPAKLKAREEYKKTGQIPEDVRGGITPPDIITELGLEREYEKAVYEKSIGADKQQFHSGSGQPMPSRFEQQFQRKWSSLPPGKQFEYGVKYGDLKDKSVFELTKYRGASEYYSSLPEEERQRKIEELKQSKGFQKYLESSTGQAELRSMMESQYQKKLKPKDKPWWEQEVGFVSVYQPGKAKEKIASLKFTTSPVNYKQTFFKELHPVVQAKTTVAKNLGATLSIPITLPQMVVKFFNKGKTLFLPDVGKGLEKRSVSPIKGGASGLFSEATTGGKSGFFEQAQKKPFLTGVATGAEIIGFKMLSSGYRMGSSAVTSRFPAVSRYNPYNMLKQNISSFSSRSSSWMRNYFSSSPRIGGKIYRGVSKFKTSNLRGMKPPSPKVEKFWGGYYGAKEGVKQGVRKFAVERGLISPYRAVRPVGYSWKTYADPHLTGEYQTSLARFRTGGKPYTARYAPTRYELFKLRKTPVFDTDLQLRSIGILQKNKYIHTSERFLAGDPGVFKLQVSKVKTPRYMEGDRAAVRSTELWGSGAFHKPVSRGYKPVLTSERFLAGDPGVFKLQVSKVKTPRYMEGDRAAVRSTELWGSYAFHKPKPFIKTASKTPPGFKGTPLKFYHPMKRFGLSDKPIDYRALGGKGITDAGKTISLSTSTSKPEIKTPSSLSSDYPSLSYPSSKGYPSNLGSYPKLGSYPRTGGGYPRAFGYRNIPDDEYIIISSYWDKTRPTHSINNKSGFRKDIKIDSFSSQNIKSKTASDFKPSRIQDQFSPQDIKLEKASSLSFSPMFGRATKQNQRQKLGVLLKQKASPVSIFKTPFRYKPPSVPSYKPPSVPSYKPPSVPSYKPPPPRHIPPPFWRDDTTKKKKTIDWEKNILKKAGYRYRSWKVPSHVDFSKSKVKKSSG